MPIAPSSVAPSGWRACGRSFGVLSTYPPTTCGIATFSAALARGLASAGADVRIVRVTDEPGASPRGDSTERAPRVVGELLNGSRASITGSSRLLNESDVALVQHEYGLYGGTDGDEVLRVLDALEVPSILIAHTVLSAPTPNQRAVLVAAAEQAERVVVMSRAAHVRLCDGFGVDPAKVVTIPHGAVVPRARPQRPTERPALLTWGLLGPGKGIERVIDAMPVLRDLPGRPRYIVAGRTHPKVLAAEGELYRNARIRQAWHNGVSSSVFFDGEYRDVASLTALVQSSAAVVLPYDTTDQVTSGVLVDAIAAGRPVVATAFPHAVELLSGGAGLIVEHDDPEALASALRLVLTDGDIAARMAAAAARLAPEMGWPVVSGAYVDVAEELLAERPALV